MTLSIWERIADTPWWIYALFIYAMMASYLATKPQIITLRNLYISSAVFIPFTLISIFLVLPFTIFNVLIWVFATSVGSALGWLLFKARKIKAIKNEAKLYIPGTWSVFILVLSFLMLKYFYANSLVIGFGLLFNPKYTPIILATYGLLSGLFIGKIIYSRRCMKWGPYLSPS